MISGQKTKKQKDKKTKINNVKFNSIQGKVKICHRLTERITWVGAGDATAPRTPLLLNCASLTHPAVIYGPATFFSLPCSLSYSASIKFVSSVSGGGGKWTKTGNFWEYFITNPLFQLYGPI